MKQKAILTILLITSIATAFGQSEALSDEAMQAIRNALKRIAVQNNTIENIIYDGMKFNEVQLILEERINIQSSVSVNTSWYYDNYKYCSVHGNYVIFWSSAFSYDNPVVIGFSNMKNKQVRHNYLE